MTVSSGSGGDPLVFTQSDDNANARLELNSEMLIELPVQLGLGSRWEVTSLPDFLKQTSVTFENKGPAMPGGEETQVFHFRAVRKGLGKLALAKVKPWEHPPNAEGVFSLQITVD